MGTRIDVEYLAAPHFTHKGSNGPRLKNVPGKKPRPPADPTNLTAQIVSGSQINLFWSDNSVDEDGFRIERNGAQIGQTGANVASFEDTGRQVGIQYSYRVRAFKGSAVSGYTNTASATIPGQITSFDEEYGIVYNVKDYGAVGNGVADDRAAIQAAIDASLAGGRRVYIPAGTYAVGNEVIVKDGVHIIGDGQTTIISALPSFSFPNQDTAVFHQARSNGSLVTIIGSNGMGKIYLKDFILSGSSVTGANGILASCQQPSLFENVRVQSCPGYGIGLSDGQQISLTNTMLIGNGIGLLIKGHYFVYCNVLDIEQSTTVDVRMDTATISGQLPLLCSFRDVHSESPSAAKVFDIIRANCTTFENVLGESPIVFSFGDFSAADTRGQVYTIKNATVIGDTTAITLLEDLSRSISLNSFYDCRNYITFLAAGNENFASGPWAPPSAIKIADHSGIRKL